MPRRLRAKRVHGAVELLVVVATNVSLNMLAGDPDDIETLFDLADLCRAIGALDLPAVLPSRRDGMKRVKPPATDATFLRLCSVKLSERQNVHRSFPANLAQCQQREESGDNWHNGCVNVR